MSPRSAIAWSSTGPWKENESVTSPPSPLCLDTSASSWPRKQTLPSSPKRMRRRPASFLRRPHEGAPARAVEPLGAASPRSPARSPRPMRRPLSRAGITLVSLTTSAVARLQQVRQVAHAAILELGAPPGRTTSSRAASRGARRPQRDALGRQVEVEEVGAHAARVMPGCAARGSRLWRRQVRHDMPRTPPSSP